MSNRIDNYWLPFFIKISLVLLLCMGLNSLQAQKFKWDDTAPRIIPKYVIKYNPYAFLTINRSFYQFEFQHHFKNDLYLNHQLGFMSNAALLDWTIGNASGIRLGSELRWYNKGVAKENMNRYVGFNARLERTSLFRTQTFDRAGGAYTQEITYNHENNSLGTYLSTGNTMFFKKRWILEAQAGAGARFHYRNLEGLPEDAVISNEGFNFGINPATFEQGFDVTFSFLVSLSIGYVISELPQEKPKK